MSIPLLCCACLALSANPPGAVYVWGPAEDGHKQTVAVLAFSPDGSQLATGARDRSVRVWDLASGRLRYKLGPGGGWVQGLSFSPDGRRLATGGLDRTLSLWDVESGALIREMNGHTDGITSVLWLPTGARIATTGRDKSTRIWDAVTGENTAVFPQPEGWVVGAALLPDGRTLAAFTGRGDEPVAYWDLVRGEQQGGLSRTPRDVLDKLKGFDVSDDGQRLAFAGPGNSIELWRPLGAAPSLRLQGHTAEVEAVALSPNGQIAASSAVDNTVRVWDLDAGKLIVTLAGHDSWVPSVVFAPDGRRLASGSGDARVIVWDWPSALRLEYSARGGLPLDWQECWEALAADDPARAHLAIWTLAESPEESLAFLAGKVAPTPPDLDRRRVIDELIFDLEDDRPSVRREAVRGLDDRLIDAESQINSALAESESLEVRHQLRTLLSTDRPRTIRHPERLRSLRAVQVLEYIGNAEARARLADLATGAAGDRLTEDARGAVQRLEQAARLRRE